MANIVLKDIKKAYKNKIVLDGISLELKEGKIYGLLGRNGSGKTTLLNVITNRIFQHSGRVLINNQDVHENDEVLSKIYFMTEKNLLPVDMKVIELFKETNGFYENFEMEYAKKLADIFALNINDKIKDLSTGYNTIFKVILTLASKAEIMIFDEPVLGLDARCREIFYKELLSLYEKEGNTIIISTHIIEEIANITEKIMILNNGDIKKVWDTQELAESSYLVSGKPEDIKKYAKNKNIIGTENIGNIERSIIIGHKDEKALKELNIENSKADIQKVFIYLTDKGGDLNE